MPFNFQHYVFDLDNTLYSSKSSFFNLQLEKMSDYIQYKLNVPRSRADFLREDYYEQYGSTMHGLMINYNIDHREFMTAIDDVPLDLLQPDLTLLQRLNQLKEQGKHLSIFTNASKHHAFRVMEKLNIDQVFNDIVTLECTDLVPKPRQEAFQYCFNKLSIDPQKAVFFEDSYHNLVAAKEFGMKTVLVNANVRSSEDYSNNPEIDYFVDDIESFFKKDFIQTRV